MREYLVSQHIYTKDDDLTIEYFKTDNEITAHYHSYRTGKDWTEIYVKKA